MAKMTFLTPDKTRTEHGITVCEKLIPDGSRLKPNRPLRNGKPEYITIHNTPDINEAAGTNDAEQYARATLNGNMNGVSVHYYIDESGCWQLLREDEMGYHAADGYYGPGNCASLAIEIVMDGSGREYDKKAEDRGALLAAILLHRHGLGLDRLTTHMRWYNKKYCPAYILPHWDAFRARVEGYLKTLDAAEKQPAAPAGRQPLYRVQVGSYAVKKNADYAAKTARALGFDAVVNPARVALLTLYRVQIGAFTNKAYAEAYAEQARKKGLSAAVIAA